MPIIFAINDLKVKCSNNSFRECRVVFRKNGSAFSIATNIKIKVSHLLNPSFIKHKKDILCYCDGIDNKYLDLYNKKQEINLISASIKEKDNKKYNKQEENNEDEFYEEKFDVELEDPFSNYTESEKFFLKEDIEEIYKKEKIDWIRRLSNNENLITAINEDYDCDDEYCKLRLSKEFPGFLIVDHTTFFYKCSYPSLQSLNLEKHLKLQVNGCKCKYGTYTRIVLLESHNNINYNDQEAVVIFNYLHKYDVICLVSVAKEKLYGGQL